MNPLIEQLVSAILEEGLSVQHAERLAHLLECAKMAQATGKAEEDALKDVWWECYQRGEVEKTTTVNGIKMQCNDPSAPKETVVPGFFRLASDWDQKYDVGALIQNGVIEWVPETRTTSAGRKGGVAVTLPKS